MAQINAYEPDTLAVRHGNEINVINADSVPHTVTSGTGPQDSNSAKSFDSSIIEAGASVVVSTSNLASGYYPYYCSIHPYMEGILRID